MRRIECEIAIVGGGTAGLTAFSAACEAGAKPIIIEDGVGGTTCARIGCMPSKLLIEAANMAHAQRTSGFAGVASVAPSIDGRAVMHHVRAERDYFTKGVFEKFETIPANQRLRGKARFLSATKLAVGDETEINAAAIIIATGSGTAMLPVFEPVQDLVLTNANIFELEDLPSSLAVVGAGPLGLELALAFSRLGVRVQLFDKGDRLGGLDDPAVNQEAIRCIGKELPLAFNTELKIERAGNEARVTWNGGKQSATFERILAAAGRPPSLDGLGLETTGLSLDQHGVPEFDPASMRFGGSSIYIAGDASAFRPVLHEASRSARIAGHAAAGKVASNPRGVSLAVTFSDPQIAVVGDTFAQLDQDDLVIGEARISSNGRARIAGYHGGLIRLYASKSRQRLVGGQMVGPGVEHVAHQLAWLIDLDVAPEAAAALPFYHPTIEEALRGALRNLCRALGTSKHERQPNFNDPPGC